MKNSDSDENESVIDEKVKRHEQVQAQHREYLDSLSVTQLLKLLPDPGEIEIPDVEWAFSDLPDIPEIDWDAIPPTAITEVIHPPTSTTQERWYKLGKEYEQRKHHQGAPYGNCNASRFWSGTVILDSTAEKLAEKYLCAPRKILYCAAYARAVDKIAELTSENIKEAILLRTIPLKRRSVLQLVRLPDEEIKATMVELAEKYGVKVDF
jgi:hypothetical protein